MVGDEKVVTRQKSLVERGNIALKRRVDDGRYTRMPTGSRVGRDESLRKREKDLHLSGAGNRGSTVLEDASVLHHLMRALQA